MSNVRDILKPKTEKEILEGIATLIPVEKFCAEFLFYFNKSNKSIDSIYSIVKEIDKIENCFVSINLNEVEFERYEYDTYSFDIKRDVRFRVIIDVRGLINDLMVCKQIEIRDGVIIKIFTNYVN
jgi:hypothetical protein